MTSEGDSFDALAGWAEVLAAVQLALGGDKERGRVDLLAQWDGLGDRDEAAKRCVLAHYLADLEPTVAEEVAWDERALAAYGSVGDTDLAAVGIPHAAGMAPSLHLNLGDGYLRLGRVEQAETELRAGLAATSALGEDGYADLVRRGLDRLADRVALARD